MLEREELSDVPGIFYTGDELVSILLQVLRIPYFL